MGSCSDTGGAIKADTLSIVAFQIGLFGYMALYHLVFVTPPPSVASPTYWFMMQIGMIIGFFTAWPVNTWLHPHRLEREDVGGHPRRPRTTRPRSDSSGHDPEPGGGSCPLT